MNETSSDKISSLIKEARPLYYARKRRTKKIKTTFLVLFMFFSMSVSAIGGYTVKGNEITLENQTVASLDTPYPIDDYGLITVEY